MRISRAKTAPTQSDIPVVSRPHAAPIVENEIPAEKKPVQPGVLVAAGYNLPCSVLSGSALNLHANHIPGDVTIQPGQTAQLKTAGQAEPATVRVTKVRVAENSDWLLDFVFD